LILGTNGPKGHPQLTAMWYVNDGLRDDLDDDLREVAEDEEPRARSAPWTLLIESGRTYPESEGAHVHGRRSEIIRDVERVIDMLERVNVKYNGLEPSPELRNALRGQASKRVLLKITPDEDVELGYHSKLGTGVY
jgi:hypothetical protein